MHNLRIEPFTDNDNESALTLESQSRQGKSLVLKYRRPTFHARSKAYHNYKIFCAKQGNSLVGIIAWAEKYVQLHSKTVRTAYLYDLRVHPEYRNQGIAKKLVDTVRKDIGHAADCNYTWVTGQNNVTLNLAQNIFNMNFVMPFTYFVIPVYKKLKLIETYVTITASDAHENYVANNQGIEFIPEFDDNKLLGYVTSTGEAKTKNSGCSIWTNENLLAEQVVSIPYHYRIMKSLIAPFRLFAKLPYIPKPNDILRSWFLFDFFAKDENSLQSLLTAIKNIAFDHNRHYIYILLQNNDVLLNYIKRLKHHLYIFPYFFLASGHSLPAQTDKIYIDIRDL